MKREFDIDRVIVAADRGINTHKNIQSNILNGEGYLYSQTVRGAHRELKDYVLEEKGYKAHGDGRIKSRIYPKELSVTDIEGKVKKVRIEEKQVVFYSDAYAKRAKAEREAVLLKARELVDNPSKYNRATSYGAAKYVKNLEFDKDTGEVKTSKATPVFDEAKVREEEKYDGYYCIVTSELNKNDDEIIGIYKGLWEIEDAFKVTGSDLETRPVYFSREEHIEAHFLTCFISLCIGRILQHRLKNRYTIAAMVESLNQVFYTYVAENIYFFNYIDEIAADIGEKLDITFNREALTLGEIKNILGETKRN
jgi:transposase